MPDTPAPDNVRRQQIALLRALADLAETDETLPIPHGYLNVFPRTPGHVAAFLRGLPLPWTAKPPKTGEHHYAFRGEAGNYSDDGMRINVFAAPGDVSAEGPPEPVMTPTRVLAPEFAALLEELPVVSP